MKVGDRVKDKFKSPRPGDECVTGEVKALEPGANVALVQWDDGRQKEAPLAILELVE